MLFKKDLNSFFGFIGILVLITVFGFGCADKKKGSSAPPAPAPAQPLPYCAPGAPTAGCSPNGTIGVPPQAIPPGGYQYGQGTCQQGHIYTIHNCLPMAGCPANQGMYNNQCIPAMNIGANSVPYGFSNQNGSWGYYYNSYPYYNGNGYNNSGYGYGSSGYPYGGGYGSGYPYGSGYYGYPYNTNLGYGFSLWVR